jgi:hypothetical protein
MTFETVGQEILRKEVVDKALKGFALRMYKFKQVVTISRTGAWKNDFFREHPDELTAGRGVRIKGIPRGAAFPQAIPQWQRVATVIKKYGLEANIPWEDLISSDIDVRNRVLLRLSRGVTKAVDDEIYTRLTSDNDVQSINITAGYEWNSASAAIVDNLEEAEEKIRDYDYPTDNLVVLINGRDKRSVMNYLVDKGNQWPRVAEAALTRQNGEIGRLGNFTFVVSNSVSASQAVVVVPKICATWKELYPLSSAINVESLKDSTIRVAELGVTQITDPKAIVVLNNTQAA